MERNARPMSAAGIANRLPITVGIIMATMMSALDVTVVNVALPHMQGSLSASPEQITWTITSYVICMATATPATGWLAARFGVKPMILGCIALFTLSSVLCGIAATLPAMVAFRALQGLAAAPLAPLSQAVLLNINPPERHGRAMALFTMASVLAPIIGPVIGGYLTENLSWRWCFFINVPAGLGSMLVLSLVMPAEPGAPRRLDFLGFASLVIAVGAFQLMLDRGTIRDWFSSTEICIEALVAAGSFWIFLTHSLTTRQPLFSNTLWRDRNFVLSVTFGFLFTALQFCSLTLLPLMMQGLLGYPVIHSGIVSAPRGIVMFSILQVMGWVDTKVDRRLLVAIGLFIFTAGFWEMSCFDLVMTEEQIIWATILQGIGQAIIFVPLTTLGFANVRPELRADAAAATTLIRYVGGSVGIAGIQALTAINSQSMHASYAGQVRPEHAGLHSFLPGFHAPDTGMGAAVLNDAIDRMALMVAYVDDFTLMTIVGVVCAPLLLLLRRPPPRAPGGPLVMAD
jgi:DHA2 family multidrug resistance protein